MKKTIAISLSLILLMLAGCGGGSSSSSSSGSAEKPIVLRLADTLTEAYPATAGAVEFARLVKERL